MPNCESDAVDCDTKQTLMPIDEALQLLLAKASPVRETEMLPLNEALGRILAEDINSQIMVPPSDNSAMDGYAVRSADLPADVETRLPISQRIPAGVMGDALAPGSAARIFTGAPIPPGADAVVMQEVCRLANDADDKHTPTVIISGPVEPGKNIRKAGEDIQSGETILKAGVKLRPQDLGLAASVGVNQVSVYKRLRVGIFFTGDELREPGEPLEPGQIYNSNRYTLRGLLQGLGCEIFDLGIVEDTLESTRQAIREAADNADLVMSSGGVSVGEEDYVRIALEELGQLDLWRINIKPGKPLAFGQVNSSVADAPVPFLGMPGNPVSVFATFCILARPFILKKQGASDTTANSFMAQADFDWPKPGKRQEYMRARFESGMLELYPNQGSGILASTSWANGLAIIPANTTISEDDLVEFIPYSELLN